MVHGHVVWVVDGYTTASTYPYSQSQSLSEALTDAPSGLSYATDQINYIRNSVKATVDAYTGKVTLYAWDTQDPVLKTWQNVFPNTLKPLSDMDGQLMSHVRYPEDLFRVQRTILGRYHVTDAGSWYTSDDQWQTPNSTDSTSSSDSDGATTTGDRAQPPYYLTMKLPGQSSPAFSLYSTYVPSQNVAAADQRGNLTGYLAVDANAGSTAGKKAADYGQLRLLTLPRDTTVAGPSTVQGQFNSDTTVRQALNLLNQNGSAVVSGNLLTIPVGGGLLYVQPVYIRSTSGTQYPLLRKVLTSFGTAVGFQDTLDESLNQVFGGNSGATTPDSGTGGSTTTAPPSSGSSGGTSNAAVQKALAAAATALKARQQAYADNDLVKAAQEDEALQKALQQAQSAEG